MNRTAATFVVVGIVTLLAIGNVATVSLRFLVARTIDLSRVEKKIVRFEKHPGRDDVHYLQLSSGRIIRVEKSVFDLVREGDSIEKSRGESIMITGRNVRILWSAAFSRMLEGMLLIVVIAVIGVAVSRDP